MSYLFLVLSLGVNGVLIWYVRKLLTRYEADIDVRDSFSKMLSDYSDSLQKIYGLEEIYGEEIIKKAIIETRFVQEACEEFKTYLQTEALDLEDESDEEDNEETTTKKEDVIRLKEGEKVSQDPATYKRVVPDTSI